MEDEWTPQMMDTLGIDEPSLPVIWDADFLYGPRDAAGEDTYVLCEINVSSCFAIPDRAPAAIALLAMRRLREAQRRAYVQGLNSGFPKTAGINRRGIIGVARAPHGAAGGAIERNDRLGRNLPGHGDI